MARRWSVKEASRNIHHITINLDRVGAEQWVLLTSDLHWDNPHCRRDLVQEHLELALERDAPVIDIGDRFCLMQGKYDPRHDKSSLRPEHQCARYLDAVIDTSVEWFTPYKSQLTVCGFGNHETMILKKHETHMMERFVERMRAAGAADCYLGGYRGWVVFTIDSTGRRQSKILHYFHGAGASAPVTRGTLRTTRDAAFLADADFVWYGHVHQEWEMTIPRVRLNNERTEVVHSEQKHFMTPGYKEDWQDGYAGWPIEKGFGPNPLGGKWLRFVLEKREGGRTSVRRDLVRAELSDAK